MTNYGQPSISITLSPTQVDQVVRAASGGRTPSISTLISNALASSSAGGHTALESSDPRLSRSLLRGLSVLARFGHVGEERGIVDLAGDLEMSPSTAHRYACTLVELGLLERCPRTRKYRLPAG